MGIDMVVTGQVSRAANGGGQVSVAGWSVPGYTGLKALGSGGFGDVVLTRHDASGALVAVKYLRPTLLSDAGFAEMFRGEAAVLASIDDPHVVRLYEYIESPSGAAIVMELVDGVSLRRILARQGATSPEAALVVLRGSLLGLAAAHARGVVHRDYKPENVLVSGDGASKLTDFGIAARAGDSPRPAGTLMYAPPEQFSGGPASPAGDVYAATATFFECLTGHPPFTGESAERLLYQHLFEPVPVAEVPEPLRSLVTAGMAKQPEDRPPDATTFVAALNTVAARAYGPDWENRGRSHLGEAALMEAALWPSGGLPAVQGLTVGNIPLRRRRWRSRLRRSAAVKAGITANTPLRRRRWRSRLRGSAAVKAGIAAGLVVAVAAGTVLVVRLTGSGPAHHVTLPAVTGVSPGSGSAAGGTTVTITGTGLADATAVRFGGIAGPITADSGTQITVTSPPSTGTVTITVTTPAGTSRPTTAGHYTYTTRPKLTQSISFTASASGTAGNSAALSASGGGSGNPVVFSVDPASGPGVCTVSGTTVTYTAAGSCVIDANQAGNGTYAAASQVQRTITVTAPPPNPIPTPNPTISTPKPTAPPNPTPTPTNPTPTPTNPTPTPTPTPTGPPPVTVLSAWSGETVPTGLDNLIVQGVSCASDGEHCVAVGFYCPTGGCGGLTPSGILTTDDGGATWVSEPVPAEIGWLSAVSCASATDCVAVGDQGPLGPDASGVALVTTNGGSSWTPVAVPGTFGLSGVSCPSTSDCFAVGYTPTGPPAVIISTTDGGTNWGINSLPSAISIPSAISCLSTTECVVTGGAAVLTTTDSGVSWTIGSLPGGIGALNGVACLSSAECVAVGTTASFTSGVIIGTTNAGASWTSEPVPGGIDSLAGVACPSVTDCVAVGTASGPSSTAAYAILATTNGGSSWTPDSIPSGPGRLDGVTCTASADCLAVGEWFTYTDGNLTDNGPSILSNSAEPPP